MVLTVLGKIFRRLIRGFPCLFPSKYRRKYQLHSLLCELFFSHEKNGRLKEKRFFNKKLIDIFLSLFFNRTSRKESVYLDVHFNILFVKTFIYTFQISIFSDPQVDPHDVQQTTVLFWNYVCIFNLQKSKIKSFLGQTFVLKFFIQVQDHN